MVTVPEPVRRMIAATNDADADAFLACFSADCFLEDWGRRFHGVDGVRAWNQSDNIGRQMHFDVVDAREQDGQCVVSVDATGNGYTGSGTLRFTLVGDQISALVIA